MWHRLPAREQRGGRSQSLRRVRAGMIRAVEPAQPGLGA
jgi:hypothetical protein